LVTFAAIPWIFRSRRSRPLLLATACVGFACLLTVFIRPHYLAPAAAGIVILSMQGLRVVSTLRWRDRRIGRVVAYGLLVAWVTIACATGVTKRWRAAERPDWARERARIAADLAQAGGRHLVFVRYAPRHSPHQEWVYNGADLGPAAPILWARAIDPESDARLMRHDADRRAWLIEPDTSLELHPLTSVDH
jgi:hypothetical protein